MKKAYNIRIKTESKYKHKHPHKSVTTQIFNTTELSHIHQKNNNNNSKS